jgi:hypothetical protein
MVDHDFTPSEDAPPEERLAALLQHLSVTFWDLTMAELNKLEADGFDTYHARYHLIGVGMMFLGVSIGACGDPGDREEMRAFVMSPSNMEKLKIYSEGVAADAQAAMAAAAGPAN